MSKHTKGPWKVTEPKSGRVQISHSSGGVVGHAPQICAMWNSNKVTLANARRIVACVNACEGFSIEELEGADLFKDSIESQGEIINLTNQRDELSARAEQLECQLAGCGVAALQNTRDSAAQRGALGDYGYSGSYEEVCRAVDREMALREQRDELLAALRDAFIGTSVEVQADAMRTACAAIAKAGA